MQVLSATLWQLPIVQSCSGGCLPDHDLSMSLKEEKKKKQCQSLLPPLDPTIPVRFLIEVHLHDDWSLGSCY